MKKVLVTGGTRGIGLGIAKAFIKKGYTVYAAYAQNETCALQAKECGIIPIKADVACEADVLNLFQQIGDLDILVNNAGVALIKQIQDISYEEYNRLFAVNMGGTFLCSREASKIMLKKNKGLIVNISSVWGEVGASCESVYSSSKSAVLGFTKALAKELGYSGIRVNAVSPGMIDTEMNAHFSKEDMREIMQEIPVGKMGTVEEIASAVLFLEENEYITGIDLPVNGGFSIF